MANLQTFSRTVPANGVLPFDVAGSFLVLVSSTGTFNFAIDGGIFQPGLTIMAYNANGSPLPPGSVSKPGLPGFKQLIFQDSSGSANTITFIVSDGSTSYYNPIPTTFNKDAPTYTKGTTGTTGTVVFNGTDSGKIRRQFTVTNEDGSNALTLLDANNNRLATVYAQRSWTMPTSGTIKVVTGSSSGWSVCETFYS